MLDMDFDEGDVKRNFQPLFNLFALRNSKEDKSQIPFNAFYRQKQLRGFKEKKDAELAEMVMKDNTRILLSYFAQIAYANPSAYPLDDIFETNTEMNGLLYSRIEQKIDRYDIDFEKDTILTDREFIDVLSTRFSSE